METPINIPWHLGIHVPEMGRESTAAGLMFEHTRLTIRAIAFLYQMFRDDGNPMGLTKERASKVMPILVEQLLVQTDEWKVRIYQIATRVRGYSDGNARRAAELFSGLMKKHIRLAADVASGTYEGNPTKTGASASVLYGDNAKEIVAILTRITRGDRRRFEKLWKDHLDCTAAYISAGASGDDVSFNAKASECLSISVRVGTALDEAMGIGSTPSVSSKHPDATTLAIENEEPDF